MITSPVFPLFTSWAVVYIHTRGNCSTTLVMYTFFKGGQTAILVRWSAAQRTTEMLADQRNGKNSGLAPADY
jgi:hypothetical protein